MSASVVAVPPIWAYAERDGRSPGLRSVLGRKGPHSLRLVQACEAPMEAPAKLKAGVGVRPKAPEPQLAFYRKYTEAMLRRYLTMSMEAGRVPSRLGQEMFRGKVTSYKVHSFEDVVIYVHDVEKCMARLEPGQQHLIRRIALQGYTQGEAAALLGIALRTVVRRYAEALDRLTAMFLRHGMLEPMTECTEGGR